MSGLKSGDHAVVVVTVVVDVVAVSDVIAVADVETDLSGFTNTSSLCFAEKIKCALHS